MHFERYFRTFKTFNSLKKPIPEANHQNRSPPYTSIPLSECLKEEVRNPSFNGLQQDGEMGWHGQMIHEVLWMPSFLDLQFICCSGQDLLQQD